MKVELKHITKRFGSLLANDDISLTVEAGTIHGLLGENGAGKSTLVKTLSGAIARDRGQIFLDNKLTNIKTPADALRAGVGLLPQDPLDLAPMTVLDNFMVGKTGGWLINRRTCDRELKKLVSQFNFNLDSRELVANLTVGERQQLELLRLLSVGVNTLILDEPTTGISSTQKEALFYALRQLAAAGRSIIFVSHKLEDVDKLCDRATVLKRGRVAGTVEIPRPAETLVTMMFDRQSDLQDYSLFVKPKTASNETRLQLKNILLKDNRLRVEIDDFVVCKGEVIGLAGLEGSGQQLLLLLCAGLLFPAAGKIYLDATDMTRQPYRNYLKSGVGYFPADRLTDGLISGLSIHDHVALRQEKQTLFINRRQTLKTTKRAIELFNIKGLPQTKVERLSGGNQQRTQLALLPIPLNLLLMEHPTRGLDIESARWVWQQLIARCQTGTSLLFTSSDLDEIMQYSDRVLVFNGGNVSPPINAAELTVEKLGKLMIAQQKEFRT